MRLYPSKLKLLHVARRQLAIPDAEWRELLEEVTGCRSSTELDLADFDAVMARLKWLGFKPPRDTAYFGKRAGMATPRQIALIRRLWSEYAAGDDPNSLDHWLEHSFGITSLRFANSDTAGKAITALKAMASRSAR
ncbi:regulatory protein GemA [Halomonas campisalis]|uniref:Regulatory protein GemA n=1 Tax=Billgrantia campisalis TaxID=74661 RepID=A0ABS9PDG9_9GAMM|nr:regulatory protein GemA [Halomonas campisalis]MCG6659302.1 regulatory protein GemA [Halomonas campisalis]MDR5864301.1 regulatory protein GemA [Halomonas campisalis]